MHVGKIRAPSVSSRGHLRPKKPLWFQRDLPLNSLRTVKPLAKDLSTAKSVSFGTLKAQASSGVSLQRIGYEQLCVLKGP